MNQPTFISLFAGCGGSSLGYKQAGYKELLAIDFDENAVKTFKLNFPDVPCWQRDIKEITGKEIMDFCKIKKGELFLLDASPPCQGFSTAGKRKITDSRNDLFLEFIRLIKELEPQVFVMENVSGLIKGKMKGRFIEIMKELKSLPYQVKCKLMNAMYYEVPQSRQRLIWMGNKFDLKELNYPNFSKQIIRAKEVLKDVPNEQWELDFANKFKKYKVANYYDELQPGKNHKKRFNLVKLNLNSVSPTITKGADDFWGTAWLCHPEEKRYLTISEIKRLSTFPDEFRLIGDFKEQVKQIGNSVPPKFMEAIAKQIRATVEHG